MKKNSKREYDFYLDEQQHPSLKQKHLSSPSNSSDEFIQPLMADKVIKDQAEPFDDDYCISFSETTSLLQHNDVDKNIEPDEVSLNMLYKK